MNQRRKTGINKEIFLLSIAIFFADASHSIVIPIFPSFAQKIGASLSILGSYGSVAAMSMLALALPLGRLSDRFGRKKLMTPGLFLFILVPLSYLIVKTPFHLYPIRILLGLGLGLIFGNGFLLMSEISDVDNKNIAQGLYMTSMGIGFTVGPLIGGISTKLFGYQTSFFLSSGFGVLSIILLQFVNEKHDSTVRKLKTSQKIRDVFVDPLVLAAGVSNFLNSLMFNAVTLFYPVYGESIGLDEAEVGFGLTARGLSSTAVRLPTGSLIKHVRVLYLMIIGLIMSAVSLYGVSISYGVMLVSILMGIQGIAYGIYLTSGNVYVEIHAKEGARGTAMAVYSIFRNIGGIITPTLLGIIAEKIGVDGALRFSTSVTLIGVIFVYILAKMDKNSIKNDKS
jgi:MFS family permease